MRTNDFHAAHKRLFSLCKQSEHVPVHTLHDFSQETSGDVTPMRFPCLVEKRGKRAEKRSRLPPLGVVDEAKYPILSQRVLTRRVNCKPPRVGEGKGTEA